MAGVEARRVPSDAGMAANLALDEAMARRMAAGEDLLHLGFGESRLPVFPGLAQALADGASRNAYGPVAGDTATREAVAGYFRRRGIPTVEDQVVLAPGSKAVILAILAAIGGDVVISRPAWVTYAPQIRMAGGSSIEVDIPETAGGVPDPHLLPDELSRARNAGRQPSAMILTAPDNPTGTTASPAIVKELVRIAVDEDLAIISDEIYRDVLFDPDHAYLSPAEVHPERTVVVTGLSKSLSLGGWRIGVARFPSDVWGERLRRRVVALASQSWSSLAGPQQAVTRYAFSEPPELVSFRSTCTNLHREVTLAVHDLLVERGISCRRPTGGFYLYPDLEPFRSQLASVGVRGSEALQAFMIDELGIAALGGHHFGDDSGALRLRLATSMLYGETAAEQQAVLESGHPLSTPPVSRHLATLAARFDRLVS